MRTGVKIGRADDDDLPVRSRMPTGTEVSARLAIETKKIEATERRTAVMERLAAERAQAREARNQKRGEHTTMKPSAEFDARRAEIDAILGTAREEIIEQLLVLCDHWQSSSDVTVARCCADVTKFTKTLQ
jgi:hypothetical protein